MTLTVVLPSIITATATMGVAVLAIIATVKSKRGDLYVKILTHLSRVERKQAEKEISSAKPVRPGIMSGITVGGMAILAGIVTMSSKRRKLHRKLNCHFGPIGRKQPKFVRKSSYVQASA
jgi:hypothetical protein